MKKKWRALLQDYKRRDRGKTNAKSDFPGLLKQLRKRIGLYENNNLMKGFETCGIYLFMPNKVLKKLPDCKDNGIRVSIAQM